jgi:hypothetical protein
MTEPDTAESESAEIRVLEARLRRFSWLEFQEDRESTQEALERYIEAVRQELRRPAINVRIHYPSLGIPSPSQSNTSVAPPNSESADAAH